MQFAVMSCESVSFRVATNQFSNPLHYRVIPVLLVERGRRDSCTCIIFVIGQIRRTINLER